MVKMNVSAVDLKAGDRILDCDKFPNTIDGLVVECNGDPHITFIRIEGSRSINPGGKLNMYIASGNFLVERD